MFVNVDFGLICEIMLGQVFAEGIYHPPVITIFT